jgi:hypothetical protein
VDNTLSIPIPAAQTIHARIFEAHDFIPEKYGLCQGFDLAPFRNAFYFGIPAIAA